MGQFRGFVMPNWIYYFKKTGGMNLIKQYWKSHVLLFAVLQFILLGKTKKSLELLRLCVGLKINHKLEKKYGKLIKEKNNDLIERSSRKVWVYWYQGLENAPLVVRRCFNSVKKNLRDWDIVFIHKGNIDDYVTFPAFIKDKFEKGIIGQAHFSDLLRLELLIKYGGLWLDSTVYCSGNNISQSILNSDLFVFQSLKPGADGHVTQMSNWLIWAKTNNHILIETQRLLYEYWRNYDFLVDYFIFHQFFSIVCRAFPEEAEKIPQFCNSTPHILLLNFFKPYNEIMFNDLCIQTCFHKLSYKFNEVDVSKKETFFDKIINLGID